MPPVKILMKQHGRPLECSPPSETLCILTGPHTGQDQVVLTLSSPFGLEL